MVRRYVRKFFADEKLVAPGKLNYKTLQRKMKAHGIT
jgi:hypothetical protein